MFDLYTQTRTFMHSTISCIRHVFLNYQSCMYQGYILYLFFPISFMYLFFNYTSQINFSTIYSNTHVSIFQLKHARHVSIFNFVSKPGSGRIINDIMHIHFTAHVRMHVWANASMNGMSVWAHVFAKGVSDQVYGHTITALWTSGECMMGTRKHACMDTGKHALYRYASWRSSPGAGGLICIRCENSLRDCSRPGEEWLLCGVDDEDDDGSWSPMMLLGIPPTACSTSDDLLQPWSRAVDRGIGYVA